MEEALALVEGWIDAPGPRARAVFFVNAHTLNLAADDPDYRRTLAEADAVFGDGTGVRWAARILHGARLVDNVNGTDFVPALLGRPGARRRRVFLLGGTEAMVARAAEHARRAFPAWDVAGHHHGYLAGGSEKALEAIAAARPDLLLVGMGNPTQERWIAEHRARLAVPVCLAIGGLFAYWSGDLDRAPGWVRALGAEWIHLLRRQPRKAGRYLLGNPRFLLRLAASRWAGRRSRV
jgi:N-acetylglucosaminyldiphosphoundecaprenol N-acetyl-beta-D-mannosaminyltransferase